MHSFSKLVSPLVPSVRLPCGQDVPLDPTAVSRLIALCATPTPSLASNVLTGDGMMTFLRLSNLPVQEAVSTTCRLGKIDIALERAVWENFVMCTPGNVNSGGSVILIRKNILEPGSPIEHEEKSQDETGVCAQTGWPLLPNFCDDPRGRPPWLNSRRDGYGCCCDRLRVDTPH